MRLLALLLVIKLAAGQLTLGNDVELVPAMANMAQITSLDVQCEKSGMTVNVAFSQPFNGVIFSKGHFSNPACRYVRANSGQDSYTFVIPMMGCGTRTFDNDDDGSTGFENMIMIQHEEFVQEIWDTARKITCDWTTRMEKLITFRPFAVDMLPAKNIRYSGDDVMCWMDIQLGKGPFSNTVDGIVKMGDELTVVIYSKDGGSEFDMLVKNCFAYDAEDLEDERTTRLQLSDDRGCLLKPKLMSYFFRTRETGTTGADIIAYASLFAFKFPDKMDVYLSCEVELCKGGCTGMCEDPGFPSNLIAELVRTSTTTTTRPPPVTNPCITQPGLPQCCARNPNHPACTTTTTPRPDPCDLNPRLPQCCEKNPNLPQCTTTSTTRPTTTTRSTTTTRPNPCLRNPRSRECCVISPNSPLCRTTIRTTTRRPTTTRFDPCLRNPRSRQCCAINPSAPQCTTTTTSTTSTSTTTARSRIDPCILNPKSPQCCIRNPSSVQCTTTTTPRPEPCDLNPLMLQCCARNPNLPQCTTSTRRTATTPRTTTTRRTTTTQRTTTTPRITTTPKTTTTPQTTTTQRTTTTPRKTTTRRTTTTPRTTTTRRTITPRPDPCDLNPGTPICCARNPFSPQCTTTRRTTTPTTPRPGPCDLNPRSPQCCAVNPNSPQCTTTTRRIITTTTTRPTTRRIITTQPSTTRRTTTTRRPTTPPRPDPCDLNPRSTQCCARNPNSPGCTTTTTQRIVSTTTRTDPCISNPGSLRCCAINPNHPQCATDAPCTGPEDTRPKCQPTTQVPRTTPNLEFHAFHKWQSGALTSLRRRRPPYGTRLSAEILSELSNTPRRRRDVALPPPPPPPKNTISMVRGFRVIGANDLAFRAVSLVPHAAAVVDSVCVPTATFAIGLLMLSLLLITAVLVATFSCLRLRSMAPSKTVEAKNPYYKQ